MIYRILKALSLSSFLLVGTALADIAVETQSLKLLFSDQGDLMQVEACFPDCTAKKVKRGKLSAEKGMLVFEPTGALPLEFERKVVNSQTILTFRDVAGNEIRRWEIPNQGWMVSLALKSAAQIKLHAGDAYTPPNTSGFGYLLEQTRYLLFDNSDIESFGTDNTEDAQHSSSGWFGFRSRFWAALILPERSVLLNFDTGEAVVDAAVTILTNSNDLQVMKLYIGPIEPEALNKAAAELGGLMYSGLWFWLRWICQGFYSLLGGIVVLVPNWGFAIMLLSVLVVVVMLPLSRYAERLQDQVNIIDSRLAPQLSAIKETYKGAKQSEKIIALYKKEGVHPLYSLKSMLGIIFIIPVFIGVFNMLAENIHLSGVTFLWIKDLALPDAFRQLSMNIPFFGDKLNLLPFIMTGFSFAAAKLHITPGMDIAVQRKQSRNLVIMSVSFLVLFYTFPAGMVLYWLTSNLVSVLKGLWARHRNLTQ